MSLLTDRQRREFKWNGFLVLPDAVDEAVVDAARGEVEAAIPEDPEDPGSLVERDNYTLNLMEEVADTEPFAAISEAVFPYADELVGEGLLEPPGEDHAPQIALKSPDGLEPGALERSAEGGHIDYAVRSADHDSGPSEDVSHHTVQTMVMLNRQPPHGGATTMWPGSHWNVAEFFADHDIDEIGPSGTVPTQGNHLRDSDPPWWWVDSVAETFEPYHPSGDPGTVVLWHDKLYHAVGPHRTPNLRMAVIDRFAREDADELGTPDSGDPFEHWPAMQDLDLEGPV